MKNKAAKKSTQELGGSHSTSAGNHPTAVVQQSNL
jgi:hypothetical protein